MMESVLSMNSTISESDYWRKIHEDLEDFHLEEFKPEIGLAVVNKLKSMSRQNHIAAGNCELLTSNSSTCIAGLPFKVRQKIWQELPPNLLPSLRLLSKEFQAEIDTKFGTQFIYDESIPRSLEWGKTIGISKLIVRKMSASIESTLQNKAFCFFNSPNLLKILQIDGPITSSNLHYILSTCPEIHALNIRMSYFQILKESRELLPTTSTASSYHCFNILKSLKIVSILNENHDNFIGATVEPILKNIRSTTTCFQSLQLWIKCDLKKFQQLIDLVLNLVLLRTESKFSKLKHLNLSFPGTRRITQDTKPIPSTQDGRHDRHFEENVQFPLQLKTLELLDLSRLDESSSISLWKSLLSKQMNLTVLRSNIGPVFWKFYQPIIEACSVTLTDVSLRQIKTWDSAQNCNVVFDLKVFYNCFKLKSMELIGVIQVTDYNPSCGYNYELAMTPRLENIQKLPAQSLRTIQLENFKLDPTDLFQFHCACPVLVNFSLQYWNSSIEDVETSMNLLEFMLTTRKYRKCVLMDWKEFSRLSNQHQSVAANPRFPNKKQNYFMELLRNLKNVMIGTVTTDNSFGFGVQLLENISL